MASTEPAQTQIWPCGEASLEIMLPASAAQLMPTELIQIYLKAPGIDALLYEDIASEAFLSLSALLPTVLAGEAGIDPAWHARGLGYAYNLRESRRDDDAPDPEILGPDPTQGHWLWSMPVNAQGGFQTWLYNFNHAIWFEASPGFYWFEYQDAHPGAHFADYLAQYGPVFRTCLSRAEAETWRGHMEQFLKRWPG